ncbi:MAG: zinc ABC transporter substrate-binding protein [Paracoccaceae bacterium]
MRSTLIILLAALALPAAAQVPLVVTDIPPVNALVAQVMGDLGTPTLLLERGADEHDLQLRPSQIQALTNAQLLVWVGPALTPGLESVVQNAPATLHSLPLLTDPTTHQRSYTDGEGINPHAWLDPANADVWLALIAANLSTLDPEHATRYHANATTARAHLATLDATLTARFSAVQTRAFITYHDAYGYFASHYALNYAGSLARGDAGTPGAARITALQDTIASQHVQCAFPEAQHDPALLIQFTEGGTVKLGQPLDPVGSLLDPGPLAYDQLLTNLANAIITCLAP